ncbi:MAG: ATP synthase F1 subunit epsilon [Ruminococcaceae bacterium]|nr:ATP synthase F1 subunit epsilon [Oscillospiraceae bacterium]
MTSFPLRIVTPYGPVYDGKAEELIVRTTCGDLGILAGHVDCVAALGMGRATVIIDGVKRYGACIGGMLSVSDGKVTLVPTTFEWAEDINTGWVEESYAEANSVLNNKDAKKTDVRLAQAKLRRALVRRSVAADK